MSDSANTTPVGSLTVTVTYEVFVHDLAHFDATSMEQAAENLMAWYNDGSGDMIADFQCSVDPLITICVTNT